MPFGQLAGLAPAEQLRTHFGQDLLDAARQNEKIVVLDGDLGNSTGASTVREEFPERFYDIGIAESNMVSIAAGLASCGYIPFATSLASFLWCNAYEQIRVSVAIAGLNVKFVGSHSGMTTNREGPSSMSLEDYALSCAMPTFTVIAPSDPVSMSNAVRLAVAHKGPVYIRSSREAMPYIYERDDRNFKLGKSRIIRTGSDATILACGLMVAAALDAAVLLQEKGIQVRVIDLFTLRSLDNNTILKAARETGAVVCAEEHFIRGGMGSAVAQLLAAECPVPMEFIGVEDRYPRSASLDELLVDMHMTPGDIVQAVERVIARKAGQ